MKEIRDIVQAYAEAVRLGKQSALATVVHVSGSSYRRPGARMLVTEDGQITGAISGGCLEGDALRKAVLAITQDKKKLVVYDTTDEEDARLGIQLGCNGIVSILFEPLKQEDPNNPIRHLQKLIAKREAAILYCGYSLNQEPHFGSVTVHQLPSDIQSEILSLSEEVMRTETSSHTELKIGTNQQLLFVEYYRPAISLIIAGAGNDVMPLVSMANILGWPITLVDGRSSHANAQRFPSADKIIVAKPIEAIEQMVCDERTAVLLMTHNYNYDLEMLSLLADRNPGYIGLLGPAAKRNRMLEELQAKGIEFPENMREKIYGPIGLNLGAETAEEIALSITAGIMAVMQKAAPFHLREKLQPIHSGGI